jgi:DNA-binding NtrC family response regulator
MGRRSSLDILRDLLQEAQYNVTTTNFVPRTFEQIEALGPSLLIIDLVVGQQAGWDLLERLQTEAMTRGIPVIVTSTDKRLLERAIADAPRQGGKLFMAKPMNLDELLQGIESLIGEADSTLDVIGATGGSLGDPTARD